MAGNFFNANGTYNWARINGYWFTYYLNAPKKNALVIRTAAKLEPENEKKFRLYLKKFERDNFIVGFKSSGARYLIVTKPNYSDENVKKLLTAFAGALGKISAVPACDRCGKPTRQGFVMDNSVPTVVCYECQEKIMEEAEKTEAEAAAATRENEELQEKSGVFVKVKNKNT